MQRVKQIIKKTPGLNAVAKFAYDEIWEKRQQEKIRKFLAKDVEDADIFSMKFSVGYEPTIRCNLKCKMCYQAQTRGERQDELSRDEALEMSGRLADFAKDIKIVGGEPFVRSDIIELIDFWDRAGKKIFLQTNCTLINELNIKELKRFKNIKAFLTSLDGPEELHDQIRGIPGTYKKLKNAVELIRREMPWTKVTFFATLLLEENLNYLIEISKTAKSLGADTVQILFEQVYTNEEVVKTEEMFERLFNWHKGEYRLNTQIKDDLFKKIDIKVIKKQLFKQRLKTSLAGRYLNFTPFNYYKNFEKYLGVKKGRVFCLKLLKPELRINPKGEVIWCDVIEKSFGNLLQKKPDEIWQSKEFMQFRNFLKKGFFPVCTRCCKAVYVRD